LAFTSGRRPQFRTGCACFAEILKGLESTTGSPVDDEQLARISPLLYEHIIPSGTYHLGGQRAAE
jgi:hypothetical protein